LAKPVLVRVATAHDQVGDGEAGGGDGALRQHPDDPGHVAGGGAVDAPAVQQDLAGVGAQEAAERPQQGGLAAAVGADDGGDRSVGDVEVEAVDDDVRSVRQSQ
jgi:hypothetical protein